MRRFGLTLLLVGGLAFFFCTAQLGKAPPAPEGLSISESLDYQAGRWEMGRYASGLTAVFGLLMLMFPKGR